MYGFLRHKLINMDFSYKNRNMKLTLEAIRDKLSNCKT